MLIYIQFLCSFFLIAVPVPSNEEFMKDIIFDIIKKIVPADDKEDAKMTNLPLDPNATIMYHPDTFETEENSSIFEEISEHHFQPKSNPALEIKYTLFKDQETGHDNTNEKDESNQNVVFLQDVGNDYVLPGICNSPTSSGSEYRPTTPSIHSDESESELIPGKNFCFNSN